MANIYVNINDNFSSTGLGSEFSPFGWAQFLNYLPNENVNTSNIFLLSGTKNAGLVINLIFGLCFNFISVIKSFK